MKVKVLIEFLTNMQQKDGLFRSDQVILFASFLCQRMQAEPLRIQENVTENVHFLLMIKRKGILCGGIALRFFLIHFPEKRQPRIRQRTGRLKNSLLYMR